MYQTSGHFPYYMDSQFPPFYLDPFMQSVEQLFYLLFQEKVSANKFVGMFEEALKNNDGTLVPVSFPGFGSAKTDEDKLHAIKAWYDEQEAYLLKPMNCPHHIQIYQAERRSYRELPLAAGGVRLGLSLRKNGPAQRHDPRPRLHAGRRPPVLHGGAGAGRVRAAASR